MIPTPLKDMEDQCHDFLNCKNGSEMPGYPDETFTGFYIEQENTLDMIKSAVEWLKNKCFRELVDGTLESRDNINTFDMHELIDEAFECVK